MKLGVNFKIDLRKIDRSRAYKAQNGAEYIDLTCFIGPEEPSDYDTHGGIQQSTTAEERKAGMKMPYVGNVKIFHSENCVFYKNKREKEEAEGQQYGVKKSPAKEISDKLFSPEPVVEEPVVEAEFDDDIPF